MKRQYLNWQKMFANGVTNKGFNFQGIQTTCTAQLKKKKKKKPSQKMGGIPKKTFLQRRHSNDQ